MKYLLIALTLLLASCHHSTQRNQENDKPIITVSIEPQKYFAEAIAGDHFKVVSMVPKGNNPENYDPTPQQLVDLENSCAYLRIGYIGFEQSWMERINDNVGHLPVFNTAKDILFITDSTHHHGNHTHEGGIEPHVWTSTNNALIIARNTYNAIRTLDKDNEKIYFERYDSLCNVINATDRTIRNVLAQDTTARSFMIYHPALSYFARDYQLTQHAIEDNGKEPSPSHLKHLIDQTRKEKIQVIFVQPEFDKRNAEVIAQQTGARIVPINPLNYNWADELISIAQQLVAKPQ